MTQSGAQSTLQQASLRTSLHMGLLLGVVKRQLHSQE